MANTMTFMAFEGQIYFGEAGSGSVDKSTMTLGENIQELKLPAPGSYGEVEHTLKKHQGAKAYLKGLLDWVLNFSISKEYAEGTDGERTYAADVQLVLDAARSRTPIRILLEDYDGGEGPVGDFLIFASEYEGSGEAAQVISCTAKPYAGAGAVKWQKNGEEMEIV